MGSGKGGGSVEVPSPSEYIPLLQEQARLNRVNTYTPWGSTVYGETPGFAPGRGTVGVESTSSGGGNRGGASGQALGGSGSSEGDGKFGDARDLKAPRSQIESRTTLSPELQRLFEQQTGMAGSAVGDPRLRERQLAMALNPEMYNQDIQDATFQRAMNLLEPGFERQSREFQTTMADRGLPVGGEAYDDEFANIMRTQNSARENAALSAVLAGNQAALQERGQNFGELNSLFSQDMAGRGQRFNELAAVLGRNQTMPTQPLDVMGPANMAMNANMANMQNQQGQKSSLTNAGTSAAAMYFMGASDRRLKEDIREIGKLGPLNIYRFRFKGKTGEHVGVMADEVEKVLPEAVDTRDDGMKMVNYGMVLNAYA